MPARWPTRTSDGSEPHLPSADPVCNGNGHERAKRSRPTDSDPAPEAPGRIARRCGSELRRLPGVGSCSVPGVLRIVSSHFARPRTARADGRPGPSRAAPRRAAPASHDVALSHDCHADAFRQRSRAPAAGSANVRQLDAPAAPSERHGSVGEAAADIGEFDAAGPDALGACGKVPRVSWTPDQSNIHHLGGLKALVGHNVALGAPPHIN